MGKQLPELEEQHIEFIAAQKLFFVGTATADSRINVSPKGMDAFRVLGPNRVIWLNMTGSGNETSAHVQTDGRMTVMFCAFTGKPLILRLYGQARVIHPYDADWEELFAHFPSIPGARQVFDLQVDLVQTSCGMAVPYFDYVEEREQLINWASKQGEAGIHQYWHDRNQQSLDGIPTHILEEE
ncbi:pyridoxamine 5'-phosphate oxidase family protein [Gimesia sp.]|uniref:pyridoxamine 5'-phosphate oxidase family protein n=1 Tax=Gimesia sp. TaxID=2024833 RepID=UPI003A926F0A